MESDGDMEEDSHDWKEGERVGEAKNPGPPNYNYTNNYPPWSHVPGMSNKQFQARDRWRGTWAVPTHKLQYQTTMNNRSIGMPSNDGWSGAKDLRPRWLARSQPESLQRARGVSSRVHIDHQCGVDRHAVNPVRDTKVCWFGDRCHNPFCLYRHPNQHQICRFGMQCKRLWCQFLHIKSATGKPKGNLLPQPRPMPRQWSRPQGKGERVGQGQGRSGWGGRGKPHNVQGGVDLRVPGCQGGIREPHLKGKGKGSTKKGIRGAAHSSSGKLKGKEKQPFRCTLGQSVGEHAPQVSRPNSQPVYRRAPPMEKGLWLDQNFSPCAHMEGGRLGQKKRLPHNQQKTDNYWSVLAGKKGRTFGGRERSNALSRDEEASHSATEGSARTRPRRPEAAQNCLENFDTKRFYDFFLK